ncbi:Phage-related lysozyme (muramidase), GH24 family [Rhizobiales bacterium GAS113]|nr:Phage-related lysozyme (muramidase), GH24 family [Rhizobiales bacterium GAS113]
MPLAQRQAADDLSKAVVTRNPDGTPNVTTPGQSFILGRAGKAYQGAIEAGTTARYQTAMQGDLAKMATDHVGDPQGFKQAADDYLTSMRSKTPGQLGEAVFQDGSRLAGQHYVGLVDHKASLDVYNAHQAITTQIEDKTNQLQALARQGGTGTPDYVQGHAQLMGYYDQLGTNPAFKMSAEKIASEKARAESLFSGEAIVGHVDSTFNRSGPGGGRAAAQKTLEDEILNNPKLNMPENERNRLYNLGMHRLQYLSGEQKAQADANKGAVTEVLDAIHKGQSIPDNMLDQVITRAQNLGDSESVERLQSARAIYGLGKSANGLTPEQTFNSHFPNGAPGAPVAVQNSTADMIRHFEGFRTTPYWDVNHYRVGYGSDTVTKPDGSVISVTPGMAITKEDAERDLTRRTQLSQADIQNHIGMDTWNKLGPASQASMTSVAYNYGHLPDQVVQAAQSGDPAAVAQAIASLPANPKRRAQEAGNILGYAVPAGSNFANKTLTMPASANGVPFTAAQIHENPFLLSDQVRMAISDDRATLDAAKQIAPAVEANVRAGYDPDPTTLANLYQFAQKHPKELGEHVQNIEAMIQGNALADRASGMPGAQGQAVIDEAKRQAGGASIWQQKLAEQAQAQFTKRTQALQSDPFGEAARREWIAKPPIPLNPADGNAFSQGLTERRYAGSVMASKLGGAPENYMFSPVDKRGMANFMASGDGAGVQNFVNGLVTGLKPQEMAALMQSKDVSGAIQGLARSGDPAKMGAAYSAMDTMQRQNDVAFKKEFGESASKDLFLWQNKLAYEPPDQVAKDIQRLNDPSRHGADVKMDEAAKPALAAATPAKIVGKFGGWLPGTGVGSPVSDAPSQQLQALKSDYDMLFKDSFRDHGDASLADKYATQELQKKWGVSSSNGGRLMQYPPEKYYPPVGGSTSYIAEQLHADVRKVAGDQGIMMPLDEAGNMAPIPVTGDQQRAGNIAGGAHALVADQATQADIAAGRPPSYQVIVTDAKGQFHRLETAPGQPMRFRADPAAPQAAARAKFDAQRPDATLFDANPAMRAAVPGL